jgi:regulatory subunit for Cdc7p protein kinase
MAAILLSPLPVNLSSNSMSTRPRAPLSSIPQAVNSPLKTTSQHAKQKRSYASTQRDDAYNQERPAKKQMLDVFQVTRTPPRQASAQSIPEQRERVLLTRKGNTSQYTNQDRRTIVSREPQQIVKKSDRAQEQDLETIRKWQKHYQKIFPSFVFYFESVPEDVRVKYTKHVLALGAVRIHFSPIAHILIYYYTERG